MILTCPACATSFTVAADAVGPHGRKVRCGKCKHEWQATAPLITAAAADIPSAAASVAAQSAEAKKISKSMAGIKAAMEKPLAIPLARSAGLAVVAALLITMPFFAMKIGPYFSHPAEVKTEDPVNTISLEGVPVTMMRQEEGRAVLDIKGVLVNRSGQLQQVPVLKASAVNARGHVIKEWNIPLSATQLEAGQRLPFSFSTPLSEQGVEDIAFKLM